MTSSWVHEEMEYPLIRTISSPTLATDRRNKHQAEGASGGWAGSLPDALGLLSREGDDGPAFPQRNLDMCPSALSQSTHPQQPESSQDGGTSKQSCAAPFYRWGDQDGGAGAQRVGSRAGSRTQDCILSLVSLLPSRGTNRFQNPCRGRPFTQSPAALPWPLSHPTPPQGAGFPATA